MMNKDKKMIEEMASIICKETSNKGLCEKCDFKKHKQFGHTYQCHKFDDAEALYNEGCRKIGEDEVVVKKSELARLKNLEINYELVYEDYRKLETTNKRLEQEVKSLESGMELLLKKYEELGIEISKHTSLEPSLDSPITHCIDYITIPQQRLAIPRLHFSEWQPYEE